MTASLPPDLPDSAPLAIPLLAPKLRWLRRYHLLALLVLAASLAVTYQLWRSSQRHALHEMQASFDFSVREAVTRIEQRMGAYEQVLHSVEGFMAHADSITRDEFRHFVEKLRLDENYPGIQGVSFAQIVPAAQMEQHLAAIRSEGFSNYAIHPGGERALYTPVIFIEPFSGRNLRAFGHDPYAQPVRRATMEQARDLDQPVMTGKLTLVQENDKDAQPGFLIYLPVFRFGARHRNVDERRASIIGWISAPFRMNDLMDGLHGEQAANLDIEIFDGAGMSSATLMYDPDHDHLDGKPMPGLFQTVRSLRIANHSWTMRIGSLPAFDARLDRNSARIVAVSGIGISLLLTLLTLMLLNGRERALQAARAMNRELIERETRYRQMFEDTRSIAYLLEPDSGRIVDANAAAAAFWGYPLEQLRNMHIAEINTAPRERIMKVLHQVSEGKRSHMEWRHLLKNGEIREVEVFSSPLAYQGKVLLYSILHDISARKQAEQALQESEARSREITATIGEGLFVTDRNGMITFSNREAQRLLGWSEPVLLGQNGHTLLHHSRSDGTPYPIEECEINRVLRSGQPFRSHDEAFWRKDGSMLPVSVNATPIIRNHQVVGSVVAFHDIIERKKSEERVHHLANYDILTDLPNRALLNDRLQQGLAKARRNSTRMALMFLDLDKFKPVNDRLGHHVGDLLLKEVAQRMQCCVRESDTVARVGGDEFVVLLPNIENEHGAQMVAQKILSTLEQPFLLAGHQLHISASIGIAIYPDHGEDEQLLIKSADQAMYQAKHGGGSALISYGDLAS
jgi:diguanylate cyclase (GGDEF)-like protein/PAS domain S-box-containing protein